MKRNTILKEEIRAFYQVPEPIRKKAFLQSLCPQVTSISFLQFMWQQLFYMKKWIWGASGGILLLFMLLSKELEEGAVAVISVCVPFLALMVLTESARSKVHSMDELELATRFSMSSVWLARMGALALLHTVILLFALGCLGAYKQLILSSICYIMVPYLLTICIGIFLLRQPFARGISAFEPAISLLISILVLLSRACVPMVYSVDAVEWWFLLLVVLLFFAIRENLLFYKQTKELI